MNYRAPMLFTPKNVFMAAWMQALEISHSIACYEGATMGSRFYDQQQGLPARATPGAAGGKPMAGFSVDALRDACIADGLIPVGEITKTSKMPVPRDGYYLVAAFMTPENGELQDFHFMRQELVRKKDGTLRAGRRWCQNLIKGAFANPSYEIAGKTRVYDPRTVTEDVANYVPGPRGTELRQAQYSVFAGFFECPVAGLTVKPREASARPGWSRFPGCEIL